MRLMTKILALLIILMTAENLTAGNTFSARLPLYASSSKLSSGKWVRIRIDKSGVYKISSDQLKSMGFSNPEKVRVFGYGGAELSQNLNSDYLDDLPEVASIYQSGKLLFYAEGIITWKRYDDGSFRPSINGYAPCAYYFLSEYDGYRKEISKKSDVTGISKDTVNRFVGMDGFCPEKVNIQKSGTTWYDEGISQSGSRTYYFQLAPMLGDAEATIRAKVDVVSSSSPVFTLSSNGVSAKSEKTGMFALTEIPQSEGSTSLNAKFSFSSPSASCTGYLNSVFVNAVCKTQIKNGYLEFNNSETFESASGVSTIAIDGFSETTSVWDVTDPNNAFIGEVENKGGVGYLNVDNSCLHKFVAFDNSLNRVLSVDSFSVVDNQNLHKMDGVDLVIVTNKSFEKQANSLAQLHRDNDGISVAVIMQDAIFNEFSSGKPDPTAIRSFMKMLYDRAMANEKLVAPRYLLLFGDGCFDNKGILANASNEKHNHVITFQTESGDKSYVADDYFAFLADNTSSLNLVKDSLQISVGRIPCSTIAQAENVVIKMENYMKNDYLGSWKNKCCIIADDNDDYSYVSSYQEFVTCAEEVSFIISRNQPNVIQKKLYYDIYSRVVESNGNRYPDVERLILENIADGTMLINYIGHSNPINWSAEKTFTQSLIPTLGNKKLGVWFSASCEFSEFDSYSMSAGEQLVLEPNGGAIAVIATPRLVYASQNHEFNKAFVDEFYKQTPDMTIGDVLLLARNSVKSSEIRLKYPLLGDPALRLNLPTADVVTDEISSDTLNALAHVSVKGHLEENGQHLSSFNGRVVINVFDKQKTCNTRGNYNDNSGKPMSMSYKDYPTILFSGEADVVNGCFDYKFIVPNDIAYNFGPGLIVYYASDESSKHEGVGSYSRFIVGGSSDSVPCDTLGPQVTAYINTPSFKNGGVVGSNPVFIAKVADMNGINSSDVGIGHDLTISLDGAAPVSLNSYFSYNLGSCTDGTITYQLPELPNGKYTLTFKAWDLMNNSSTSTIEFVVKNGKDPSVNSVVVSPNPAVEQTTIVAQYDRPLSNVDYKVSIYDFSGRILNEYSGTDNTPDGVLKVKWDLNDASGCKVQAGDYLVKVRIRTLNSEFSEKSAKIVVLAQ